MKLFAQVAQLVSDWRLARTHPSAWLWNLSLNSLSQQDAVSQRELQGNSNTSLNGGNPF